MDKTFNFFKCKAKKENERPRNNSKSNSSKQSYNKQSERIKQPSLKPTPLTKKQKDIREAIENRYQKSKLRIFQFNRLTQATRRDVSSSHSSDMEEFKHLKKLQIVDIKEYHRKQQSACFSNQSSQQKKKFNMRFKFRQNTSSQIIKTQGNQGSVKHGGSSKIIKNGTPTKIQKKSEEWKYISIQLKQDLSKPKTRKAEVKLNSHRSYNLQQQQRGLKMKSNSSMNKYLDKAPSKLKDINKLNKTKY